jgi:hypothetical protein
LAAVLAVATPDGQMSGHAVADPNATDRASDGHHDPCCLVARYYIPGVRGAPTDDRVAVIKAHIASTDGGGLGLHQDFVGFRLRPFPIGDKDLLVPRKNYCTHRRDSFF